MRFLNIIIGLVILVCIILVSYSHTVLLFNSVGIVGWKGHLATIAVEATFILSCFNLVVARLKKYRPSFFSVAGFFYGSGITAWSNISFSYEYGYAGRVLGLAIPVGLWIAEGIISHSLLKKPTNQNPTNQPTATKTTNNKTTMVDQKPINKTAKSTNRKKSTNKAAEEERIKKAYFDYVEQNGKPPSQREWAEKAGVSRYKIIKFIEKYGEPKKM